MEETNEEVVEETTVEEESTEENTEETKEESSNEDKTSDEPTKDDKEHNRQGYEHRKKQGGETDGSQEGESQEDSKVDDRLSALEERNSDLEFRNAHPEISDDAFKSIKAQSKGSGQGYEEVIKNDPIIKSFLETNKAKARVEGATPTASTKTTAGGNSGNAWEQTQDEFEARVNKVMNN